MAYVKLDTGILDSTLWIDRDAREVFITALLMAEPEEFKDAQAQLEVRTTSVTGFEVPPGWYGFVRAAGVGIAHRAQLELERALAALERLGGPEPDSRTPDFEGRRLVRVSGGYVILNYMKYRDRDHTAAERQRRLRARRAAQRDATSHPVTPSHATSPATSLRHAVTSRIADANADAGNTQGPAPKRRRAPADESPEFKAFRATYPKRNGSQRWPEAWGAYRQRLKEGHTHEQIMAGVERYVAYLKAKSAIGTDKVQQAATFLGTNRSYLEAWEVPMSERPADERAQASIKAMAKDYKLEQGEHESWGTFEQRVRDHHTAVLRRSREVMDQRTNALLSKVPRGAKG